MDWGRTHHTPTRRQPGDITMVAGEDPHEGRGTDSLMFAMVRPNGSPDLSRIALQCPG